MARPKVNKKFYEPKDVKYRFRWTFLDVLRKEYEAKVIRLEEALPLYKEVTNHPLWGLTPIGYDTFGWGQFDDHEGRDFFEPISDKTLSLCEKIGMPLLPQYTDLLTKIQEWAKELGLSETPWIYEVAFCFLREMKNPYETEILDAAGEKLEVDSKTHPIISAIVQHVIVLGGSWHFDLEPLPRVPEFTMYNPWDDEHDYSKKMHDMIDQYVRDSKKAFRALGFVRLPNKEETQKHCKWLCWRLVEGMGWGTSATRENDAVGKNVSHLTVRKAILGDEDQKSPGIAEVLDIPLTHVKKIG